MPAIQSRLSDEAMSHLYICSASVSLPSSSSILACSSSLPSSSFMLACPAQTMMSMPRHEWCNWCVKQHGLQHSASSGVTHAYSNGIYEACNAYRACICCDANNEMTDAATQTQADLHCSTLPCDGDELLLLTTYAMFNCQAPLHVGANLSQRHTFVWG